MSMCVAFIRYLPGVAETFNSDILFNFDGIGLR
jgi:hypothetical protein